MIYFFMAQPILQYGITSWGGLGNVTSNKIRNVQKSIVKIILNTPKSYFFVKLFEENNAFTVQQLFYRSSLYFTYKFQTNIL